MRDRARSWQKLERTGPRAQCGSGPRKGGGPGSSETRSRKWMAATGNAKVERWADAVLSVRSLASMSTGKGREDEEDPAPHDHPTGFVECQAWEKKSQTCLAKSSTLHVIQAASQQIPQTLGIRHLGKIGGKRVNPVFQL